ncbi:MAG TPA: DUF4893 domain-containing protein [Rhizomicrobium sp.]|nr:DUF4893 domain-containing protein [Rhizomicrobium sp.]
MGGRITKTLLALALALASTPVFAGWREAASAADIARIDKLDQIRALAMADARQGRGQGDQRTISQVMEPEGHAIPSQALLGDWRCRQIKLGGMGAYMVYDRWFNCNIRPFRGGLLLQKMDGSQRLVGMLFPENGAWVYVGASNVRGEPWHNYSGASPALGAQVTPDDQIGLLTGIGDNHLRLEIPAVQESLLDVVEFAR